jgi:hypothetical protein
VQPVAHYLGKVRLGCAVLLITTSIALADFPLMLWGTQSMSASANWGSVSGSNNATSPTETIKVPYGNLGVARFVTGGAAAKYSKSGAGFVTLSDGATIGFTNGNTLAFQLTVGCETTSTITVTDNATGKLIGTFELTGKTCIEGGG